MKRKLFAIAALALVALAAWAIPTRVIGTNATRVTAVLATSPVKLWTVFGQTTNSSSQYVHVYESSAAATNGGTPKFSFPIGANQYFSLDFGAYGADMDAVSVCNSTTPWTTTLGTSNCSFQAVLSLGQ